jgi:ABC-2 type transport system ATP-binding protein
MSSVVEVERLTKTYGDLTVVDTISFSIEMGKIYGLLGRNGAGKTTIMQMLAAHIFATSGEVRVFGEKPFENRRVLSQICFIRENQKYPDSFRVKDILDLSASFFPCWDREYAHLLSEDFQLPLKRRMKTLSKGMLSSVGIVVGLASRAPLTIFDEPYMGLDVVVRSLFYDRLIEDYNARQNYVLVSYSPGHSPGELHYESVGYLVFQREWSGSLWWYQLCLHFFLCFRNCQLE